MLRGNGRLGERDRFRGPNDLRSRGRCHTLLGSDRRDLLDGGILDLCGEGVQCGCLRDGGGGLTAGGGAVHDRLRRRTRLRNGLRSGYRGPGLGRDGGHLARVLTDTGPGGVARYGCTLLGNRVPALGDLGFNRPGGGVTGSGQTGLGCGHLARHRVHAQFGGVDLCGHDLLRDGDLGSLRADGR
ncbi:hypothetical protein G3M58_01345, partial [Streptomyces sp. SID7499]|nr:hypothetical protein [Streptomyces sp. SID7499]